MIRFYALTFLLGIFFVQQLPVLPNLKWVLLPTVLLILLGLKNKKYLSIAFMALGFCWAVFRADVILQQAFDENLEGKDLLVVGRIVDVPKRNDFGVRFIFAPAEATLEGNSLKLPARISLNVYDQSFTPHAGERWRFYVRLKRPHGLLNPGAYDAEAGLFRAGIRARGYVRFNEKPALLDKSAGPYWLNRWRERLSEHLQSKLIDSPIVGLAIALIDGDRRGINQVQRDVMRRTGTSHLIAISGLHVGIVTALFFFLFRYSWGLVGHRLRLRWSAMNVAAILSLFVAIAYAALAGFALPTQRALIMVSVAMLGLVFKRHYPSTYLLSLALFAVLLWDPIAVLSAGFWLSFIAVALLVFAAQGTFARRGFLSKWGRAQWFIAVGLLPIMLVFFQQMSLSGPLVNFIAVPVFSLLIIPLCLLGALLSLLSFEGSDLILQFAVFLFEYMWNLFEFFSRADILFLNLRQPGALAFICGLVGVAVFLAPRAWPTRWIGAVWMLPLFFSPITKPLEGEFCFAQLDVGQGLAVVAYTRDFLLLYDTGVALGDNYDMGRAVVLPYLAHRRAHRIDRLVISHSDIDHIGGLKSIRQVLPINTLLSSVPKHVPHASMCHDGQTWRWNGVHFSILNPTKDGVRRGKENNHSCVVKISSQYGSILLTGDIEAPAERALLRRHSGTLQADILFAPHHGSKTSSVQEFIQAVAPQYVLISAGYRNRYRHPAPSVLARYEAMGAKIYNSAYAGAVRGCISATGIDVKAYRDEYRRYWHFVAARQ